MFNQHICDTPAYAKSSAKVIQCKLLALKISTPYCFQILLGLFLLLFMLVGNAIGSGNSGGTKKTYRQTNEVNAIFTGIITDEQNNPLPKVSVTVKGTSRGTATNDAGKFSIDAKAGDILVFSIVGYVAQELKLGADTDIRLTLVQAANEMEQVVVVGFGTQKKSRLIGSVAQVGAAQVNNRAVPQLSQALTGQLPGVAVIQRSGQPGASGGNIQVRGVGSFGASAAALILVDGIPTSSLDNIDPNDVENISVLKDASSAAIYGARAANGVILVTTKTGKTNGKLKINYNGYIGSQKPTAYPEQVASWEFAGLLNEAQPGTYSAVDIQKFKDGSDKDNFPDINYVDKVYKKSSMQTGHNISLSSSTPVTQYQLSMGYMYQNGIVIKNNFNRYNIRLNMTNNLSKKLKLTTRLSGIQTIDEQPAPPATLDFNDMLTLIAQVVRYPSIYPDKLSNGDWGLGNASKGTPVSFINSESLYKNKGLDLLLNSRLDWEIIDHLNLSVVGGYTHNNNNWQRFLANQRLNGTVTLSPGTLNQQNNSNYYKTLQELLEYTRKFGDHELGVLLGHSFESFRYETSTSFRAGFVTNQLTQLAAGDVSSQTNTGSANESALDSYFGRLRYSYKDKYLLEGVLRRDGSSRFPPEKKYATFPAIAVGWRLSQEKFMQENVKWINDLKLKASYGTLGNQNIGSEYPYQSLFNTGYNYPLGAGIATGVAVTTVVDSTLHWESTRTKDVGIELTVLDKSLSLSATYFDRYTYDILVSPGSSVSAVLGFGVGTRNSGSLINRGWEFTAGYKNNIGKNFNYNINANFTMLHNEVRDLGVGNVKQPNGLVGNGSNLFINYPVNLYYGLVADGIFVDQSDITSYPTQTSGISPGAKPGDIRYKDISGPDGKPDGKVDLTYDRTVLGTTIAKYTYGASLGASYKGFDLNILLQGAAKVSGRLTGYAGYAFFQNGTIQRWQADGRWTSDNPNPNATYPRLEIITNQGTPNSQLSSFWLLNGSYLRIKSIQVGYNVPSQLLKKARIDGLRIYGGAENLVTFNKYPTGWDPEINSGGAYYPILANYTIGLNLSF